MEAGLCPEGWVDETSKKKGGIRWGHLVGKAGDEAGTVKASRG